jgi:putative aldouronate transport system substrate-binding protein
VRGVTLPTYVPFAAPTPDLPGNDRGLDPAYLKWPSPLKKSVAGAPSSSAEVTGLTQLTSNALTPMEDNAAWREVNRQLGTTLRLTMVPNTDYQNRFATTLAGTDLPDLLNWPGNPGRVGFFAGQDQFMPRALADLTPYLSGDAVKEFPNLANFPTYAWTGSVFGKQIYGLPRMAPRGHYNLFVNQAKLAAIGISEIRTTEDLQRAAKELTRPASNQYALATYGAVYFGLPNIAAAYGAPFEWRLTSGKLTRDIETPEYKAAVEFTRGLVTGGYTHPDSLTMTITTIRDAFVAEKIALMPGSIVNYPAYWNLAATVNPNVKVRLVPALSTSAGSPKRYFVANGQSGQVFVKKGSTERVKEMLRVLDFLAAPFGSQEYLLLNYGLEGTHFALNDSGNPISNDKGRADLNAPRLGPWGYLSQSPFVQYNPASPDQVRQAYQEQQELFSSELIENPVDGVFSATLVGKGAVLDRLIQDRLTAIIGGREQMSDYDQMVKDWQSQGGDQVRKELEEALAAT